MKTLASVFNQRRREAPPRVVVAVHPDSQSSSSDGSAPTPDDDRDSTHRPTNRFSSWIKFKPTTISKPGKPPSRPSLPRSWPNPAKPRPPPRDDSDTEEDSHSGDDDGDRDDDREVLLPPPPIPAAHVRSQRASSQSPSRSPRRQPPSLPLASRAHINMRAITLSSINCPPCPPPFVHAPSGPVFPRSMNSAHSLPVVQTTQIVHHKTILVKRLESRSLSASESESIAAFGSRPKHAVASHVALPARKPNRALEDEDVLSDLLKKNEKRVGDVSLGVRKWIKRPFFEQRCVSWVWHPEQEKVVCRPIQGSDMAVAALEYSIGLEAVGGIGVIPDTPPEMSRAPPPPLRIAPPDLITSTSSSTTPNLSPGPLTPTTPVATPTGNRKTIRFSIGHHPSDQDEDDVPLGYHVLSRREQEERERKQREEEQRKKMYAAEVAAARARREAARAGALEKTQTTDTYRSSYLRPAYDPSMRRQASEPDTRQVQGRHAPPPAPPSPQRFLTEPNKKPRPLSTRSTEDIQEAKNRRRASAVSESGSVSGRSSQRNSFNNPTAIAPSVSSMPPLPPVPPMPVMSAMPAVPVIPMHVQMPVFVPNPYFVPSPTTPTSNSSSLRPSPSLRPNAPASRSAERLPMTSSKSESGRPSASRRVTVQVTPSSASVRKEPRLSTFDNRVQPSYRASVHVSSPSPLHRSAVPLYASSSPTRLQPQRVAR